MCKKIRWDKVIAASWITSVALSVMYALWLNGALWPFLLALGLIVGVIFLLVLTAWSWETLWPEK